MRRVHRDLCDRDSFGYRDNRTCSEAVDQAFHQEQRCKTVSVGFGFGRRACLRPGRRRSHGTLSLRRELTVPQATAALNGCRRWRTLGGLDDVAITQLNFVY